MPIANQTAGKNAIYACFKAAMDASAYAATPVLYPDVVADKVPDGNYVKIFVDYNTERQASIGGDGLRRYRIYGLVMVQIFTPFGKGEVDSDLISGVVKSAFRGVNTGADAITFRNARAITVGQSGAWLQANVTAEFDYDEIA
jgi:hypothetical protein